MSDGSSTTVVPRSGGIPFDALERMSEVRPDEHDVGGIEVDGERQLGAGEGGVGETLVVSRVSHALRDEGARRTRTADHQDPHRSASSLAILVKSLGADNHSCFRRGGKRCDAVGAPIRRRRRPRVVDWHVRRPPAGR